MKCCEYVYNFGSSAVENDIWNEKNRKKRRGGDLFSPIPAQDPGLAAYGRVSVTPRPVVRTMSLSRVPAGGNEV